MLKGVVSDAGTARGGRDPRLHASRARPAPRRSRGRTATSAGKYVATFVGMVPASNPRLVVLVTVDEPHARDLRRHRRGAGVRADRRLRPAVPRSAPTGRCGRTSSAVTARAAACRHAVTDRAVGRLAGDDGSGAPRRRARGGRGRRARSGRGARPRLRRAGGRHRARCSSACRERAPTGTTSRREAVERAPWRSSSSAPLDVARAAGRRPDARAAMARRRRRVLRRPTEELEVAGVTGTNGKTTTAFLLFAILAAAGRRPGLLGTIEARVGGERRGVKRTTPEAIDLQRLFREMLDAGDRSCAMEASSHASALHRLDRVRFARARLHEPQPGASRLPRGHGGLLPGEAAALPRRSPAGRGRNIGDEYGRRLAGGAARRADVRLRGRRRGRPGGARRAST